MNQKDENRNKYGIISGMVGIALNILLFAGKFFAGWISHSISITADAFNNLSDAAASVVTLIGFKISGTKADSEHPYGHGRMEYVSAFIIAAIILLMGFELLKSSVSKIIKPAQIEFSYLIIIILIISIVVKAIMFTYNYLLGIRLNSAVLKATATDSISDVFATTVVLIATIVSHCTGFLLDGYGGLLVACFILWGGYSAGRESLDLLLGQKPDKEFLQKIEDIALNFSDQIYGVHDLMVHDYGPGRRIISLHAEVPAHGDILKLHDIIDNLERKISSELNCSTTIHMDPIVTDDPVVLELKGFVTEVVAEVYPGLTIHDFRIVEGDTHTNLIFDMVVPFKCKISDKELKESVDKKVKSRLGDHCYTVIDIDRSSLD